MTGLLFFARRNRLIFVALSLTSQVRRNENVSALIIVTPHQQVISRERKSHQREILSISLPSHGT